MSFIGSVFRSDSCENGITREKLLANAQENHLFQTISGSKAMLEKNELFKGGRPDSENSKL